jgi:copper chaperone CopZ
MALTSASLVTTGMHCGSCAMLIDMTVGELDGVESVKTAYADGKTQLTYDPDVVTMDAILDAIRGAGYDAEQLD